MNQNLTITHKSKLNINQHNVRFFTETIDVGRISPLAFFEAGNSLYKDERFYWQNADKTLTLVGIGHATVLTSDGTTNRFKQIAEDWEKLCSALIKEEKDINPVLFGGFSFDPENRRESEWSEFPSANFVVPSFQLTIKDGKTTISINLVTESAEAVYEFENLRNERDRLIHIAQVEDFIVLSKPNVTSIEEIEKERYLKAVSDVTANINSGIADKVVIARSVKLHFDNEVSSVTALHHISNEQQESYHFGMHMNEKLFFGATPERLIEISNGRAYSACVAGSIKRGKTALEDKELGSELMNDYKNRAEHQYVVNMISTVFKSFCKDFKIPKAPKLMKIRDIQHLVTPVEGNVEIGTNIFNIIEKLHPTPALGGVPTNISLDIIRNEEKMDRGYYAAPIGWTDTAGNGEFAVAIRSALLDGRQAYLYAGGGIVADSEPDKEYDETWVKFRPVMRALGGKLNG